MVCATINSNDGSEIKMKKTITYISLFLLLLSIFTSTFGVFITKPVQADGSAPHSNQLHLNNNPKEQIVHQTTYKWINAQEIEGFFPNNQVVYFYNPNGINDYWASAYFGAQFQGDTLPQYTSTSTCNGSNNVPKNSIIAADPADTKLNGWTNIWYLVPGKIRPQCGGRAENHYDNMPHSYPIYKNVNLNIKNPQNADIFLNFSGNNIVRIAPQGSQYTFSPSGYKNLYVQNKQQCPDEILYNPNGPSAYYNMSSTVPITGKITKPPAFLHATANCYLYTAYDISRDHSSILIDSNSPGNYPPVNPKTNSTPVYIGGTPPKNPGVSGGGGGSGGGLNTQCSNAPGGNTSGCTNACDSSNPLGWILCQIYDGVGGLADWIYTNFIKTLLMTNPVSLIPSSQGYQMWSTFRLYGNIFLIIVLLIVVFGEALGGGLIDAYTVKRILPRLLAAAILINLSIYIVAALVDVTNIVAGGIGAVMTPSVKGGAFSFHISTAQSVEIGLPVIGGISTALIVMLMHLKQALNIAVFLGIAGISFIFFAFLALALTLALRQIGILVLILVSPVAFALYCLPNTEKYFRKWWEFLLELLLVYPIVSIFLAASDLFRVAMGASGNGNSATDPSYAIVSFLLQFIPVLAVPFAIGLASKTLKQAQGVIKNLSSHANKFTRNKLAGTQKEKGLEELHKIRGRHLEANRTKYNNTNSRFRRGVYRMAANVYGGRNFDYEEAEKNQEDKKFVELLKNNGPDRFMRAATVNKKAVDDMRKNNTNEGVDWKIEKGQMMYRTLGGAWATEFDVDKGRELYSKDYGKMQAIFAHEMNKATTDDEVSHVFSSFNSVADGLGMNEHERQNAWTAASFDQQNVNREFKHVTPKMDASGNYTMELNGLGLMTEWDEKIGSGQAIANNADTWVTMQNEVNEAANTLSKSTASREEREYAKDVIERAKSISKTTEGAAGYPVGYGAPGRVATKMDDFVNTVNGLSSITNPIYVSNMMTSRARTPWGESTPGQSTARSTNTDRKEKL